MVGGFGKDLRKWYILRLATSGHSNRWHVCPPLPGTTFAKGLSGASFETGAEALAAFAKGVPNT